MITSGAHADRRDLEGRLIMLRLAAIIGCGLVAVGFWVPQVVEHERYRNIAENQHLKTINLRAPRGVVFDRNNRVLVENTYSFTIAVLRDLSQKPGHNVDETVLQVAQVTGLDPARTLEDFRRHKKDPQYKPVVLIEHATMAQVAAVMARQVEMPEVIVQQEPTRTYPAGGMGGQMFGYVSEIQDAQLERPEYAGLAVDAVVGQAGLEKTYNSLLTGQDGKRDVSVNSHGTEISEMGEESPVDGNRLQLTIDDDMQKALDEAFKANDMRGAAVFMDPRTGEILAMTSQPSYDPNDFAAGLNRTKWAELKKDPLKPVTDRLIQGKFGPGSSF
jgi:penicillin-binding protein 2